MNFCFVEVFYWVVFLCSIMCVVEKLYIMQLVLLVCIVVLEEEFGVVLLDCCDKQFCLMMVGQCFDVLVQCLLDMQCQVKEEMGSNVVWLVVLCIGVIELVVYSWFIDWLQQMCVVNFDFELELMVEILLVFVDQVCCGVQDFVFVVILVSDGGGVCMWLMLVMIMGFVGYCELYIRCCYVFVDLVGQDLLIF